MRTYFGKKTCFKMLVAILLALVLNGVFNINDIVLSVVTNVQKFQDQSISLNWYYDVSGGTKIPESEAINRLFILPTKYGLKTSYYLNFNRDSEEEEELDIKKSLTEEMSEEEKLFYSKLKEAEDEVCENCSI